MNKTEITKLVEQYSCIENAKDRLFFKLVPLNTAISRKYIFNSIGDIAITCHILVCQDNEKVISFGVNMSLLRSFGITKDQLFLMTMENTRKITQPHFDSLENYLHVPGSYSYFICDDNNLSGSALFMLPEIMDEVADCIDEDFFVIPSSKNELIFTPVSKADPVSLTEKIKEINKTVFVGENNFLSDHLYHFNVEKRSLTMCGF